MDYMEKITDLRARKKDLKDQAAKLVEEDKLDDATALADQMEAINKQIAGLEALAKALAASVKGESLEEEPQPSAQEDKPKGFICKICGFVYESDTLPDDFVCPICRRPASDFEPGT